MGPVGISLLMALALADAGAKVVVNDLGGSREHAAKDVMLRGIEDKVRFEFEQTFMFYLPRICEHCLNPSCAASCPSGAIYKREEDGIVLVDQDRCRGWRMCVSGCPYKKIYYNWKSGKAEKCIFCYPRIEAGQPTVCSETCVGRIRYLGVILYDADKIEAAASAERGWPTQAVQSAETAIANGSQRLAELRRRRAVLARASPPRAAPTGASAAAPRRRRRSARRVRCPA